MPEWDRSRSEKYWNGPDLCEDYCNYETSRGVLCDGPAQSNRLSVVVPVYMGSGFLQELYERIKESATHPFQDFELILVNDVSPDNAWSEILALCKEDSRLRESTYPGTSASIVPLPPGLPMSPEDGWLSWTATCRISRGGTKTL